MLRFDVKKPIISQLGSRIHWFIPEDCIAIPQIRVFHSSPLEHCATLVFVYKANLIYSSLLLISNRSEVEIFVYIYCVTLLLLDEEVGPVERKRKKDMLKSYYGMEKPAQPVSTDPCDINGPNFEPQAYLNKILQVSHPFVYLFVFIKFAIIKLHAEIQFWSGIEPPGAMI